MIDSDLLWAFIPSLIIISIVLLIFILISLPKIIEEKKIKKILIPLGYTHLLYTDPDNKIQYETLQQFNKFQPIHFFQKNKTIVESAKNCLKEKQDYALKLSTILNNVKDINIKNKIQDNIKHCKTYNVLVYYKSPKGRSYRDKLILYAERDLQSYIDDPYLLLTLEEKKTNCYDKINKIIDDYDLYENSLINNFFKNQIKNWILTFYDSGFLKQIKKADDFEMSIINKKVFTIETCIKGIVNLNNKILGYYNSDNFIKIKNTYSSLIESQKEFNEYIDEKVKSIANLFGTRVIRNETIITDTYEYIRPYKKTITPFTAEVSAQVFASAENNPLDYIIKYFYPDKSLYPEQIQKLQLLIEELETLKEAKNIIDNYKKDYQQYIVDVPDYIMRYDENGFYSRLGFANINENILNIEYKFSYTSNGGMAQRNFTIPMTEETVIKLINKLEKKLTMSAFTKEQRALMSSKLRQYIKKRDNYTCKYCGNSTYKEPNLLLEIDHIIPVSKGGLTKEDNLQTLCWRCNRTKSNKIKAI